MKRLSNLPTAYRFWFFGIVLLVISSLDPFRFGIDSGKPTPGAGDGAAWAQDLRPDQIVTVLPKDAIPAILSPAFDSGRKISWLDDKDLIVGVEIGGDSRAYPVATLSRHEIVNDMVGRVPIAVTW
jgi:hypothetical protein